LKWGSDCIVDRLGSSPVKQYITVASITWNRWHFVAATLDRQRHIYQIYIDERKNKKQSFNKAAMQDIDTP
jgi:hypothetical protein